MKKKWLSASFFLFWGILVQAQYATPGTGISWSLDDLVSASAGAVIQEQGNYIIHDDLTISLSDTILLLENAVVKFQAGRLITVKGIFRASPPDSILFTAVDTLENYKGFRFEDSDGSEVRNCIIEYGGGTDILNSSLQIEACTFRWNDKSNCTGVIDLFHSSPQILDCAFISNQGPAVLSGANSECSPLIKGNLIYRNNTQNTNMPQINLGTSAPEKAIEIVGNTIEGFYDKAGGIAVTTLAGGYLECLIDSNVIFNNRYGITVYGFDITSVISNNLIHDNTIENLPMMGGSGINFWGGTSNMSHVCGNEIRGNLWGITNTGDALPNLGQVEPDTVNPGGNRIFNNGNLGVEYALYNNTPNDIFAENNYWGSYDMDSVELVIFHYPDDEALGFVDYLPIMDSLTTQVHPLSKQVELLAFPNPADTYIRVQLPLEYRNAADLEATIFDAAGRPAGKCDRRGAILEMEVAGLSPGIYFIVVSDGSRSFTSRFVRR